ncbi:MAG: hypothetical protein RIQ71_224 [Verrucomicrobiota bacterium]|jgi:hypothetical protein
MVERGGSEMFVMEAAIALRSLNHGVAIYSRKFGALADPLRSKGVELLSDPRLCPWEPDIIHGQHRFNALRALFAFPKVPAVLHIHGFMPDLEKPFCHPRIFRYLVISEGSVGFWSRTLGLREDKFTVLLNSFDSEKFATVRKPPTSPVSALLYCNSGFDPADIECISNACSRRKISLTKAGRLFGRELQNPERLLPDFDIVFAAGRSAIEAAASGCGVIPLAGRMAEEFLTPANYGRLRRQNMAPAFFKHHKLEEGWILRQIDLWNSETVEEVARMVRQDCNGTRLADDLLSTYNRTICEAGSLESIPYEKDLEATFDMLNQDFERSIGALEAQLSDAKQELAALQESACWRATAGLRRMADSLRRQVPQ